MGRELVPDRLAIHDTVTAIRNKHIAHSVNDMEVNTVSVQLFRDPSTDAYAVRGVAVLGIRMMGITLGEIKDLRELCRALTAALEDEESAQRKRVEDLAKALPISDFVSRMDVDPPMFSAGMQQPDRARRR